jgi:hypothetical protein
LAPQGVTTYAFSETFAPGDQPTDSTDG